MKNNVISIIVDSVIADYVGNKICKASPTPFVDSLVSESITASRMYSPGPFTDAATRSLFTGRDCLDDYSYPSCRSHQQVPQILRRHSGPYRPELRLQPQRRVLQGPEAERPRSLYGCCG